MIRPRTTSKVTTTMVTRIETWTPAIKRARMSRPKLIGTERVRRAGRLIEPGQLLMGVVVIDLRPDVILQGRPADDGRTDVHGR